MLRFATLKIYFISTRTLNFKAFIFYLVKLLFLWCFRCAPANQTIFRECRFNNGTSGELYVSGEVILSVTEPDAFPFWINMAAGVAMVIIFRFAAYMVLRYIRNPSKEGIK